MELDERIVVLENENRKLRDDNEKLLKIITQMKTTLNRLVERCLAERT